MQQMSAEEFIKKFKNNATNFNDKVEVINAVTIKNLGQGIWNDIIENVTFKSFIYFIDVNIVHQICFYNCTFEGDIVFLNCSIETNNIAVGLHNYREFIIAKCTILSKLYIKNLSNLKTSINIINCDIEDIYIENINIPQADLIIKSDNSKIENFVKHISINELSLQDLHIENIKINVIDIINNVIYQENNIEKTNYINNIHIKNSEINEKIYIQNISLNHLNLDSNKINNWVQLYSIKATHLSLTKNICKEYFVIINCDFQDSINIDDGSYIDFEIAGTIIKNLFTIIGATFNKDFNVNFFLRKPPHSITGFCNEIYIENSNFLTSLNINTEDKYSLIDKITINCSPAQAGTINISNCYVFEIRILRDNHKLNINLSNIKFKVVRLEKLSNYGNIVFSSCHSFVKNDSLFSIKNSNLGKTQFYDFDFDSFYKIDIKNAVLTEIVTANVTWFLPEKLNQTEEKNEKYYKNQREVYRQLKQSTDKQGDRIQSLDFQAEEMKVYSAQLKLNKTNYKVSIYLLFSFLCGLFKSMFFIGKGFGSFMNNDKFILWLSQTNDFGLSWKKPTWLLVRITLWVYILITASAHLEFDFNSGSIYNFFNIVFYENFAVFFQLFNPTRDIAKVLKIDNDAIGYFIHFLDISHRLIFGFFVFQIASGFRKYVK